MDNDISEISQFKSDLSDMSKQLAHKDYELERLSSEIDRLQEDDYELER